MLDQNTHSDVGAAQNVETCDLVVIGAGIAGLNALYVSTEYLDKDAKVLLIDQKDAAGGMWNTAYDYVRLHQPHPMFTVGDMKWDWKKPADYLAARDEVQAHLASALKPIGERVTLATEFGHTVVSCREVETPNGHRAEVTFHPNDASASIRTLHAKRAIYASGLDYRMASPLPLSSSDVISIAPGDVSATLSQHPDAAVYVVGGGKTGMDTVLAALSDNPNRKVSLISGRGTNFLNRTKYIPTGLQRWTSGMLVSRLFHDLASNFDGDNEDDLMAYFRKTHSTDTTTMNGVFLYGLQSEGEKDRITDGLEQNVDDYLQDVTDGPAGPEMRFRGGTSQAIPKGSIVVNCTGSFFRDAEMAERIPILSPHDTILSITARDGFHFLTSVAGFFLPHLLNRDTLRDAGFYTIDHENLFRQNRNAWIGASALQAYMNQAIAVQNLPLMLLDRCGLDLDRWYPFPRRMKGLITMKMNAKKDIADCRRKLDRVAERFGVHCGPLA